MKAIIKSIHFTFVFLQIILLADLIYNLQNEEPVSDILMNI